MSTAIKNDSLTKVGPDRYGLVPIVIYGLLVLGFFHEFLSTTKMAAGADWIMQGRYFAYSVQEALSQGVMPYWLPYFNGGLPNIFSMNTTFFYPTFLLANLVRMTPDFIFQYDFILHIFLSGCFSYMWLRRLGLSVPAAGAGGAVYMLSGNMVTLARNGNHIYDSMALIPLVFFFIEAGWIKSDWRRFALAGAVVALMSYANGWQFSVYTLIIATIYLGLKVIFETQKLDRRRALVFTAYSLLTTALSSLLLSAVVLLPSWQYSGQSVRSVADFDFFTSWSVHPVELLTYILPSLFGSASPTYWGHSPFIQTSFYIGILPIVLSVVAITIYKRDKRILGLAVIALLALFLSLGRYNLVYRILYYVPVLSGFRDPGRWLIFFTWASCGLSALAIEELIAKQPGRQLSRTAAVASGVVALVAGIAAVGVYLSKQAIAQWLSLNPLVTTRFAGPDLQKVTSFLADKLLAGSVQLCLALVGACLFLAAIGRLEGRRHKSVPLLALLMFLLVFVPDVWLNERGFISTIDPHVNDKVFDEIEEYLGERIGGARLITAPDLEELSRENRFVKARISTVNGYHGLPLLRFNQAYNYFASGPELLQVFNVKYILSKEKLDGIEGLKYSATKGPANIKIYEYDQAPGEAFLVRLVEPMGSYEKLAKGIDLKQTALIEGRLPGTIGSAPLTARDFARVTKRKLNELEITVDAAQPSVLVVSDAYYPSWKANVNKIDTRIFPVNILFRGVIVPAGKSTVIMRYDASLYKIGVVVSLLAWILLALAFIRARRRADL